MRAALALLLLATACSTPARDDGPCTCTPANVGHTKDLGATSPMDGASLLARLRRHHQDVLNGVNARDIKVLDDQLRFAIVDYCQPCAAWVTDRVTIEEMFPMDRLGDAASATCLGLVLRDGTTIYGSARPRSCR